MRTAVAAVLLTVAFGLVALPSALGHPAAGPLKFSATIRTTSDSAKVVTRQEHRDGADRRH